MPCGGAGHGLCEPRSDDVQWAVDCYAARWLELHHLWFRRNLHVNEHTGARIGCAVQLHGNSHAEASDQLRAGVSPRRARSNAREQSLLRGGAVKLDACLLRYPRWVGTVGCCGVRLLATVARRHSIIAKMMWVEVCVPEAI